MFRDLADECSRLILDLPDPGADPAALRLGLDPTISPYSRDVAWFGLTRWRELVAQLFDPPCHTDPLARLGHVRIEVLTPKGSDVPRLAVWLAAWLAGQLGWQAQGSPERAADGLRATFLGHSGTIGVEIVNVVDTTQVVPRLHSLTLTTQGRQDGCETFRLYHPTA